MSYPKQTGFTIVELLIVIVVIAILAAISVVAYNGIQNRAKTTAGYQLAQNIIKKAEIYRQVEGFYPSYAQLRAQNGPQEARLDELYSTGNRPNPFDGEAADGGKRVGYYRYCGGTATNGATIIYFDYGKNKQVAISIGNQTPSGEFDPGVAVSFGCN